MSYDILRHMGVSKKIGIPPKMDVFFHRKPYEQMDDFSGFFPTIFLETPIYRQRSLSQLPGLSRSWSNRSDSSSLAHHLIWREKWPKKTPSIVVKWTRVELNKYMWTSMSFTKYLSRFHLGCFLVPVTVTNGQTYRSLTPSGGRFFCVPSFNRWYWRVCHPPNW